MDKDFKIKGHWWIPENPETRLFGTLKYKCHNQIILNLIGSFQSVNQMFAGKLMAQPVILGLSLKGKNITLLGNSESESVYRSPGHEESSFISHLILIGIHIKSAEELLFSSFEVHFSYLEEWLGYRPIKIEIADHHVYHAKHQSENLIDIKLPAICAKLIHGDYFSFSSPSFRKLTWHYGSFLKIVPTEAKTCKWIEGIALAFRNLLSLLIGQPTTVTSMYGTLSKDSNDSIKIHYVLPSVAIRDLTIHDILFPRSILQNNLAEIFNNWFMNADKLKFVRGLYFGTINEIGINIPHQFVTLMRALESYHRNIIGGEYMDYESYKPFWDIMKNNIPKQLDPSLRESLKSRLRYGYQLSLRRRLDDISKRLSNEIKDVIATDFNEFLIKLKDARDYLIHLDPELGQTAFREEELLLPLQRLKLLIGILLYKEIGIDDGIIIQRMPKHPIYGHIKQMESE